MKRLRNLALFGTIALLLLIGLTWTFRGQLVMLLGPLIGVNVDSSPGGRTELTLPDGYAANVFAEGLDGPRFMAVSRDGVLYVAERGADRVVALPDHDGDGRADEIVEVGTGYGRANDLEFIGPANLLVAGESTLWMVVVGEHRELVRRPITEDLPSGGSHSTKSVAASGDGRILLSIGSSCDVCDEEDERRATVQLVTEDGVMRPQMVGLRNAVGVWIDPATGRPWATNMGRDFLGDDLPPETVYELVDGADAGWPRCHAGSLADPDFGTDADPCEGVAQPAVIFAAHMAPLGLVAWQDHLVVAMHGSWNSSVKVGYSLWWLPWDGEPAGEPEPFATGFLPDGADDALGRPVGVVVGGDGALYVSDDKGGFIYRITAP